MTDCEVHGSLCGCTFNIAILLQHLVRLRWEELSPTEHRHFANVAVELMSESAYCSEEWALKSQTAALVAEVLTTFFLSFEA